MNPADRNSEEQAARFARLVEENFGLYFSGPALEDLAFVLQKRIEATGSGSAGRYLQRLNATWREEWRALASLLTVTESYFFRSPEHFPILVETAIPELRRADRTRPIRIVSAGCASGEEPFSIAIALIEQTTIDPAGISILGFNINPVSIARASAGRYPPWSLRTVPERVIHQHFCRAEGEFIISERIRAMVAFEERNLMDFDPGFWQPHAFDVIFCRNVLMYLSPQALQQVVATFARSLIPDGYLFLGHAESLHGVSRDFLLQNNHGAFYYRPRSLCADLAEREKRQKQALAASAAKSIRPSAPAPRPALAVKTTASERNPSFALHRDRGPHAPRELSALITLSEALALIDRLPPQRRDDPDVVLLTAALLYERGKLDQAEELCNSLLAADKLNPAAHYLTALCREQQGDRAAAAERYRAAIHLDPNFAMPHLRLALALKRAGNLEEARVEFEQTMLLLGREDPARLLLFAGGFSREALLDLCRRELRDCGAAT